MTELKSLFSSFVSYKSLGKHIDQEALLQVTYLSRKKLKVI